VDAIDFIDARISNHDKIRLKELPVFLPKVGIDFKYNDEILEFLTLAKYFWISPLVMDFRHDRSNAHIACGIVFDKMYGDNFAKNLVGISRNIIFERLPWFAFAKKADIPASFVDRGLTVNWSDSGFAWILPDHSFDQTVRNIRNENT
jgi:hypothetical protein